MTDIAWDNIRPTEAVRLHLSPYQQGRDDERAAVVAWLRRAPVAKSLYRGSPILGELLADIARGEHLKPAADDAT